jgi:hypothetical protein
MQAFMANTFVNRLRVALVLTLVFAAKTSAADNLRVSYSAVNATQAFLWVAQEAYLLYVDAKSSERNEAYGSFSAACAYCL